MPRLLWHVWIRVFSVRNFCRSSACASMHRAMSVCLLPDTASKRLHILSDIYRLLQPSL